MEKERNKKQINHRQDILLKAKHICDNFNLFTNGFRVMFLIQRAKEGAISCNNDKLRKLISTSREEFESNLYELLCNKNDSTETLRIYSSVNSRDINKAIRKFKQNQLDNDYSDEETRNNFYLDIKNRFVSSIMSPSSASESYFVVDIDETENHSDVLKVISEANLNENIVKQYPTKNGWHIVMKPFNPALLGIYSAKIGKDSLILLDF